MKQILKFFGLVLFVVLVSCHSHVKPSPDQMKQEKITLVQVIEADKDIRDVFGDTLKTYNQYYLYSRVTNYLIPLSLQKTSGTATLDNYLMGMGLFDNNGSDTVKVITGTSREIITVRQFRLKDLSFSYARLN